MPCVQQNISHHSVIILIKNYLNMLCFVGKSVFIHRMIFKRNLSLCPFGHNLCLLYFQIST